MDRLKKDPRDIEAITLIGGKYQNRANQDKALESYRKALRLGASGADGRISYGLVKVPCVEYAEYSIADLAMFAGGGGSASKMREFIKKYPTSPLLQKAYLKLGTYYSDYGAKAEAEDFFEDYISRFPEIPQPYLLYAQRILLDGGDAAKGAALIQKSFELTRTQIATTHIGMNIADFERLAFRTGDKDRPVEVFDEAFLKLLGRSFALETLSFTDFWLDRNILKDEAERYADLAAPFLEGSFSLQRLADVYLRLNKADKAVSAYGPAYVARKWDDAGTLSSYASFWAIKGRNMESALKAARRSVEIDPGGYAYYWSTLSDVLVGLKDYPEALKAAEKAVELSPDSASLKTKVEKIKKLMKKP